MPSEPTVEEVENLLDGIQHWGNIDDSLIPAKTRSTLIAICRHFLASPMTAGEFAGLVIAQADEWCLRQVSSVTRAVAREHNITIVEPKK